MPTDTNNQQYSNIWVNLVRSMHQEDFQHHQSPPTPSQLAEALHVNLATTNASIPQLFFKSFSKLTFLFLIQPQVLFLFFVYYNFV